MLPTCRLRAVIMMTDMRNFTGLSDQLSGDAVIALLDDYFDAIVSPIEENKGEVLKFMGDGVLAIFPADDDEDFAPSSQRALEAAIQGRVAWDVADEEFRGRHLATAGGFPGVTADWVHSKDFDLVFGPSRHAIRLELCTMAACRTALLR